MGYGKEHDLGEMLGPERGPLGVTAHAEPSCLAREREQELVPARWAPNPCEAALGQPAVQKGQQRPLDLRSPEPVARGEPIVVDLLEGLEVLLGQAVKGRAPDATGPVQTRKSGNGLGHTSDVGREPGPRANPGAPGGNWPEPPAAAPESFAGLSATGRLARPGR